MGELRNSVKEYDLELLLIVRSDPLGFFPHFICYKGFELHMLLLLCNGDPKLEHRFFMALTDEQLNQWHDFFTREEDTTNEVQSIIDAEVKARGFLPFKDRS